MSGFSREPSTQATHMLFAWVGALVTLPVIYGTAAVKLLASTLFQLPLLVGLLVAVAIILGWVVRRPRPAWLSLPMCAVLGALFTSISVCLTMLCTGMFA